MSLALESVIGFAGGVRNGLIMHPDGVHQIYPLGCNVVILNTETKEQSFLTGHTDKITCMALSKSGNLLATGQQTFMGFKVSSAPLTTAIRIEWWPVSIAYACGCGMLGLCRAAWVDARADFR
jgi:hypothetical protein